mmetsp:Transcript_163640/g.302379  ORF Transcript_163640/g.302379 Transcript_163640/m.302379 type:complete len:171 (+) Transcript_163640:5-517(+)
MCPIRYPHRRLQHNHVAAFGTRSEEHTLSSLHTSCDEKADSVWRQMPKAFPEHLPAKGPRRRESKTQWSAGRLLEHAADLHIYARNACLAEIHHGREIALSTSTTISKGGRFFASPAQQAIIKERSGSGQSGGTASRSGLCPLIVSLPTAAGSSSSKGISRQMISKRIML